MISTHYTLELYNCVRELLSPQERYQSAYPVTLNPTWLAVYYHGTCGPAAYSRAVRTIDQQALPKIIGDVQIVCWKTLNASITSYDLKKESAIEVLERTLSEGEKAPLIQKLQTVLKDDASDASIENSICTWKKWGIYKENMGQLSVLLLQRNSILAAVRSKTTFAWDAATFPERSFCVTTRVWVAPAFVELAKKTAELITTIDSHRSICLSMPEHSFENPPLLQISRIYQSQGAYLKASNNDHEDLSLDISLDLLLRIIATTYTRHYWVIAP